MNKIIELNFWPFYPDLGRNVEDIAVGGLGIYMAKKVMDSVEYSYVDGQNVLTMTRPVR
jgi:anti-sigma regulatory factor (Ser/Thr protein kinase)